MTDILPTKPNLPADFIDCSVGEPHLVREVLFKYFNLDDYVMPQPEKCWEYPSPFGYKPLVQMLEDKHGHPVVITNGAKQALGATFYALKKINKQLVGMVTPYWALLPQLLSMHGLQYTTSSSMINSLSSSNIDSFLLLAPNNPDGQFPILSAVEDACKSLKLPLIHDAAYYTHIYVPRTESLKTYGDAQIFSISKMFGLSGLRIGYVVCPNPEFYNYVREYVEHMTVGVSIASQVFLADLINKMKNNPDSTLKFEEECSQALSHVKRSMLEVDKEVLDIPESSVNNCGMFGFFKTGPKFDQQKARLNFISGTPFGMPGMIRMNLAWNAVQIKEIVKRLNESRE